jgi:hypothetical protein
VAVSPGSLKLTESISKSLGMNITPEGNDGPPTSTTFTRRADTAQSSEECWESWLIYFSHLMATATSTHGDTPTATPTTLSLVTSSLPPDTDSGVETIVDIYEIMQSFGANTTYTASDGLPRLRFIGVPTITRPTIVSKMHLTVWNHDVPPSSLADDLPPEFLPISLTKPTCIPKWRQCNQLWNLIIPPLDLDGNRIRLDPGLEKLFRIPTVEGDQRLLRAMNGVCGLRRCNIGTVEEVVLLYWPPCDKSRSACTSTSGSARTIHKSVVHFRGQNVYLRGNAKISKGETMSAMDTTTRTYHPPSPMYGNFTFVSPTAYVAHRPLSVHCDESAAFCDELSCSVLSTRPTSVVRPSGIIPVHSTNVYTVRTHRAVTNQAGGVSTLDLVHAIASGSMTENYVWYATPFPLDFMDLPNPVPASAYFEAREDCWGSQTHCVTITDDTFRPAISLDAEAWRSLLPETDVDCIGGILDDPPEVFAVVNDGSPDEPPPSFPQITHSSGQQYVDDSMYAKPASTVMPLAPAQTAGPRQSDLSGFYGRPGKGFGNSVSSTNPARSRVNRDRADGKPFNGDQLGDLERNGSVKGADKGKANGVFSS